MNSPAITPSQRTSTTGAADGIALLVTNVTQLNNGAMEQVADFLQGQSLELRARFIERCASLISSVAERDAPTPY